MDEAEPPDCAPEPTTALAVIEPTSAPATMVVPAMVTDLGELPLCLKRDAFHFTVDLDPGQLVEAIHQRLVVCHRASGVSGLERKWQTDRELASPKPLGDRPRAIIWSDSFDEARPRRVVEQQHATRRSWRSARGA